MPIEEVDCPRCRTPLEIGLPRNYHGLEVSAEPNPAKPEDVTHHTRRVDCPEGHGVYFYFERQHTCEDPG